MRPLTPLVLGLIAVICAAKVEDECMVATSCGQCIQKGPSCAWCMDPASPLSSRCQKKTNLEASGKCMKENIYQPVTGSESPPTSFRIGDKGHHNTTVMMEPQIVTMKVKMGEPMKAQFKYKHVRPAADPSAINVQLQHSELPSDFQVKFFIMCKGKRMETKRCDDVPDGELMDIEVEVTLKDCAKVTGTQTFSLGVIGYRGVAGIYINPLCGCECEIVRFHEKASHFCSGTGNLICGQCQCDKEKGGNKCECPLAQYGVKNYKELEDKCREKPGSPICGGNGKCNCGKCQCDSIQVSGDFCSCDNTSCPVGGPDARQCSGRGMCKCGKCECEEGFERDDCSCETSKDKCIENGKECGGNGHCECGKCVCNNGWTGAFCAATEKGVKKGTFNKTTTVTKKEDATTKSSSECGDDDECPLNQAIDDDAPVEDSELVVRTTTEMDFDLIEQHFHLQPPSIIDEPVIVPAAGSQSQLHLEKEDAEAEEQSSSSSIVSIATVLLPLALARYF
ncbi:hypothetical protein PFISCL1PPCAC_23586 [Pristionchus fissidentatus]|uniref:Integrin beta subunit VWA domain-containing protein n=1 Tax=Pristionchus fissidentatus TaxID=1538716 RepID=A0AAV5WRE2_9BILA|nr:hypothetical protein PFISCL1PPCAC_23586 [Pristionchus fissidentatus]